MFSLVQTQTQPVVEDTLTFYTEQQYQDLKIPTVVWLASYHQQPHADPNQPVKKISEPDYLLL